MATSKMEQGKERVAHPLGQCEVSGIELMRFSSWSSMWMVTSPFGPASSMMQRSTSAGGWVPRYADYLFVAFTTSFAFSPTDTLPLTRRAKMLMQLQAAISVVTLTGVAGSAINILAGAK